MFNYRILNEWNQNEVHDNDTCQHPQFPTTQTKSFGMR